MKFPRRNTDNKRQMEKGGTLRNVAHKFHKSECYQGQVGDRVTVPARQLSALRTGKFI